jgi:hypothetical protein
LNTAFDKPLFITLGDIEYTYTFSEIPTPNPGTAPQSKSIAWFDMDKLPFEAVIRNKNENDLFSPLGMCLKRVKLITFLNKSKILKELQAFTPLLAYNNVIIWVTGYHISDEFKIDATTRRTMEIKVTCKTISQKTDQISLIKNQNHR